MSYILNALKKSEQERLKQHQEQEQTSDLARANAPQVYSPAVSHRSQAISLPKLFVLLFLAMCLAIGLFLVIQTQFLSDASPAGLNHQNPQSNLPAEQPIAQVITEPMARQQKSKIEVVESKKEPFATESVAKSFESGSSADTQPQPVHSFSEVTTADSESINQISPPFEVLKAIPTLEISGHLYTSIPEKRTVTMNGREWREGQFIRDGIRIQEITSDGLVLNAGGWPVVIGRSQGWEKITEAD